MSYTDWRDRIVIWPTGVDRADTGKSDAVASAARVRCIKVSRPETHGRQCYIIPFDTFSWAALRDEFDGAELNDSITVTLCEMSQPDLEALREFDGW